MGATRASAHEADTFQVDDHFQVAGNFAAKVAGAANVDHQDLIVNVQKGGVDESAKVDKDGAKVDKDGAEVSVILTFWP